MKYITYILLLAAGFVAGWFLRCEMSPCSTQVVNEADTVWKIHINDEPEPDTIVRPVIVTKYRDTGSTKIITKHDTVTTIDTPAVINEYYSIREYRNDTLRDDSAMIAILSEQVTENRIQIRRFQSKVKPISVRVPKYFIGIEGGSNTLQLHGLYRHKNFLFGAGYDFVEPGGVRLQINYNIQELWQ